MAQPDSNNKPSTAERGRIAKQLTVKLKHHSRPEEVIEEMFDRLQEFYDAKFVQPNTQVWQDRLGNLTMGAMKYALTTALDKDPVWPPTLGLFINYARQYTPPIYERLSVSDAKQITPHAGKGRATPACKTAIDEAKKTVGGWKKQTNQE